MYLAILCIYSIMLYSLPLCFIDSYSAAAAAVALSQSIFSPHEQTIQAFVRIYALRTIARTLLPNEGISVDIKRRHA